MGRCRPKNSLNVTEVERERIRALFLRGVRFAEIVRRTGRCESVIARAVQGMRRPRPRPRSRVGKRNTLIVQRVTKEGLPLGVVARRVRLSKTMVCQIVRQSLGLIPRKADVLRMREQAWLSAADKRIAKTRRVVDAPVLTRAQVTRRNTLIRSLAGQGVAMAALSRRFGIAVTRVRGIIRAARSRPGR